MARRPNNVIAVYGALRSGTTLLRLMLDQHQDLFCPGEADYIFDCLEQDESGSWRCRLPALNRDRIFLHHRSNFPDQLPTSLSPEFMVRSLFDTRQNGIMMLHRNLDRILDTYPDLKIIHLLRDPRDVARSSIGMGWAGNVYHGATHWIDTESAWTRCGTTLPEHQVLTLHYEALIEEPKVQLQRLCDFIEIDFHSDMLSYDQDSTYSKPDTSLTYQWKKKQTPHEIGLIEARLGPLLEASGYMPSGHPQVPLTGWRKRLLELHNRRAIWRVRIKRFGLIDPMTVAIARRLRMPWLGDAARRRLQARQSEYLK